MPPVVMNHFCVKTPENNGETMQSAGAVCGNAKHHHKKSHHKLPTSGRHLALHPRGCDTWESHYGQAGFAAGNCYPQEDWYYHHGTARSRRQAVK